MVTIIIPTLNEERGIGLVIDELLAIGYRNILVVDGYSKDRTVEIARSRGVNVVYQRGVGKAGAIVTAIESVSTPYMLVMDGDYTYDPRDVERLLKYADESDEVIGYRVNRENIPLLHRVGNWIISIAFSIMFGKRIRDPCSGMYLLRTEVAKRLEIASGGFDVEVEIAGQVASLGRIVEVPVSYRRRVGEGKLKAWRDGFRILMTAVKVMWLYNPVFFFSALVSILAVPGAVILLEQLTLRYLYGAGAWSIGWSWLGLVLFVAGLQGLSVAVISLLLKRMERRIIQLLGER
ncbi:MAG: glycosyltransferase family 2 protein [Candidatus Bathyarchaeia archaeon]